MRSCFRKITGQPNITDFRSYSAIDDTIAEAFETGDGPGPSNNTQYRLHFGTNYQKSRWNKYVVSNMLAYSATLKEKYRVEGDVNKEAVKTFFHDFIKEAQTSWACYGRRVTKDDNLESTSEAKERAELYSETKKGCSRMNSRKHAVTIPTSLYTHITNSLLPVSVEI